MSSSNHKFLESAELPSYCLICWSRPFRRPKCWESLRKPTMNLCWYFFVVVWMLLNQFLFIPWWNSHQSSSPLLWHRFVYLNPSRPSKPSHLLPGRFETIMSTCCIMLMCDLGVTWYWDTVTGRWAGIRCPAVVRRGRGRQGCICQYPTALLDILTPPSPKIIPQHVDRNNGEEGPALSGLAVNLISCNLPHLSDANENTNVLWSRESSYNSTTNPTWIKSNSWH